MSAKSVTAFAMLVLFAGCSPKGPDSVYASAANPPAAFCEAESGRFIPASSGNASTCMLSSGEIVDAAEHYRQNAGR
jgi:putative hemolysin